MKQKVVLYIVGMLIIVLVIPIIATPSLNAVTNSTKVTVKNSKQKNFAGIESQDVSMANDVSAEIGQVIDSYQDVPVYFNGSDYTKSYGESYSADGYYYGLKWQCVEYVKRFYYLHLNFVMPDGFGNAKDFYNSALPQGAVNKQRGLVQYRNGGSVKPQPDDILVFTDTKYGHVGIITKVTDNSVELIQQNEEKTRVTFSLVQKNGRYTIGSLRKPAGWLRISE